MLLSLTLADFVLVERLSLDFQAGFSVLTGETGAGKSILLGALSLVLGERADAGVVRQGAQRAEVSAEFDLAGSEAAAAWLREHDLADEEAGVLMRRVIEAGGRSRAYINGRPANAQQLKELGEFLVDIHGQHAHYSLLKSAEQRRLLDAYAGCGKLAEETAGAFRAWSEAGERRRSAESDADKDAQERERLEWTVNELAALDFDPAGWLALQETHHRLTHAVDLARGALAAAEALNAEETGLLDLLGGVRGNVSGLAEIDPGLKDQLEMLENAVETLHEVARELGRYAERVDLDPEALAQAEARLAAIQGAARKYRIRVEELPAYLEEARARLKALGEAADLEALVRAEADAEQAYRRLAEQLSEQRGGAARRLGKAATAAMQQLAMKGGRFNVALTLREPAAHGLEDIEFLVSPHHGQAERSLAKTASGGELSRVGLALQTVLSGVSGAPTLIFDEVDAGIGGGVAEIVGHMLADLGTRRQVLCVTHLPQVAARAGGHYLVSKESRGGSVATQAIRLEDAAPRIEEVARMLGGVKITETTRRHAAELLGMGTG